MDGQCGQQRQYRRCDLSRCDEYLERAVTSFSLPLPARFWVIFASIALTVFATFSFSAFILDRFVLDRVVSKNNWTVILVFVGLYGNIPVAMYLSRRFRRRRVRRNITLRYLSDGSPYYFLTYSSDEPTDDIELIQFMKRVERWRTDPTAESVDEFECFVAALIAAVKQTRGEDTGPATSIKPKPT
jgi:hypothetical protein